MPAGSIVLSIHTMLYAERENANVTIINTYFSQEFERQIQSTLPKYHCIC